jgi:uncharacterized protein (TIGR02145 family)
MKKYIPHLVAITTLLLVFSGASFGQQGHQITDIDGNYYNIITIGSQVWMVENLKVTTYNDGTPIRLITDPAEWDTLTTSAYCWYDNDGARYKNIYGSLYYLGRNTYPYHNPYWSRNVCPIGWKLPQSNDLSTLFQPYGGEDSTAGALKEIGTVHWLSPNTGATNESGFTALPGGFRETDGTFKNIGYEGSFWTMDLNTPSSPLLAYHLFADTIAVIIRSSAVRGYSARCLHAGGRLYTTPSLSTTSASHVTSNSAKSGGIITDNGDTTIIVQGTCWSTSHNPTTSNEKTVDNPPTGTFTSSIINLLPGKTYYARAYATNSMGTAYGNEISFTTYKSEAITDIDSNYYNTVTIGPQIWTAENLKTTRLNDNTPIPNVTVNSTWMGLTTPAYCWYNNDADTNKNTYGALYNWYSASTNKLCPVGWHVPAYNELGSLTNYLIYNGYGYQGSGSDIAKSMASNYDWTISTTEGTVGFDQSSNDSSNFTALPGGGRFGMQGFRSLHSLSGYWSSTSMGTTYAMSMSIFNDAANVVYSDVTKFYGYSVRCLKSVDTLFVTNISDTGPGSFRAAIQSANSDPDQDIILFNIQGIGPFVIKPQTALPLIINPVIIEGTSQPGTIDSTNLLIKLDGTNAGTGSNGLTINASYCSVKGLEISKFSRNGIQIISGYGNRIGTNSIYNNSGRGIDLGSDGVTVNDDGDGDTGPNNLQNYPVLDSVRFSNNTVTIAGMLKSEPDKEYWLEFYASKVADSSGYGEGQTFLGISLLSTNSSGNANFTATFPTLATYGDVITATATELRVGNTSEFSKALGGLPEQVLNGMAFHYEVNNTGVPNVDTSLLLTAVNNSFNTWSGVQTAKISFSFDGRTSSKYANASDGINLVSFTDDQYPFGPGVIAITAKTIQLGATDTANKIMDADIVFNPYFVKVSAYNLGIADNASNAGYFDIQSIVTHEIGHILGLLHSGVFYSTMFFQIDRGIDFRSLEQDDKSWASYKYPLSTYHGFGSVSGNIKYGYDTNQPVAGALVLAINTATKDTVHAYSDASGHYLIPGLVHGSYNLHIEPLDGNVYGRPLTSRNISIYIYSNTRYTDYPGEYYSGNNESSVEATDIVTPITVNAGSETTGKNFITNKDVTPPNVVSVTPPDPKISPDIIIKFSEPVAISTFTTQSCYLIRSGDTAPLGGSYTVMGDSTHIILFTPSTALNFSTSYTLHITSGVTDLKSNGLSAEYQKSFTTGQDDKQSPTVIDVIPEEGADSVFVTQKIMLFFSEPMDKASVVNNLSITPAVPQPITFSWDNENKVLTVIPFKSLGESQTYTVTLTKSAKDLSGNAMASNKTFTFKTVVAAPPAIIYLGPPNNITSVTLNTPVVVDFSEPINTLSITSSSFSLSLGGNPVPGSFEFLNDNSRVIFRPAMDLEFNTTYTIRLTNGIEDVSPTVKHLKDSTTIFTTAAAVTKPHVEYIDPPAGVVGSVVLISGQGFDPNPAHNTVTFSGITNPVPAVVTDATLTSLTVVVPAGALPGPFVVSSNGTQMINNPLSTYFYVVPETLYPPCDQLATNIKSGSNSRDLAATNDGATAYVTNSGSNSVSVIDMNTLSTISTISVGETPMKIDINPAGTRVYVTNFTSHTVSVIDITKTPAVVCKTINVGINPYGVAISSDGKYVYVANYTSENISVIDADPNSGGFDHAVANINTGTKNRDDAVTTEGMLAVAGDDGLKLFRITHTANGFDYLATNVNPGSKTRDVDMSTNGALAFVTTLENELMIVDIDPKSTTFGAVVSSTKTGARPGDVKGDFNGMFIYVTDPDNNQVSVYQLTGSAAGGGSSSSQPFSLSLYKTINVGTDPEGLFITPKVDAYQLLVVNSGGATAKSGSVSVFRICCAANTASEDIGNVIYVIQGMISQKIVSETLGQMLIAKMNDALLNIARGKTKTAINSLTAFIGKVKDLMKGKQIPAIEGNELIDAANKIIAKLKTAKSLTIDTIPDDNNKQASDLISVSRLGTVFPNPFSETVTINYEIANNPESINKVLLRVYDLNGRLVRTLVDQSMQPGRYTIDWNGMFEQGGRAPQGTYFIIFRNGNVDEVKTIMLIR